MRIEKILNNNVAIAINEKGNECVVTGKGVAYGLNVGDTIAEKRIQKVFAPRGKGVVERLSHIIEDVPLEHIKVCDEIINLARNILTGTLGDKIYLGLIDHVTFAIERHQGGVNLASSLKWEMQQFYPEEFRIGLLALDIIEKRLGIRLPDDEAAFIAFHLVNAGSNYPGDNVQGSLAMISGIFKIITEKFEIEFDKNSVSYNRFLTHLKFFAMRVFRGDDMPETAEPERGMLKRFKLDLPGEYQCVKAISSFMEEQYGHTTSDDEKTYLIIHIHSMLTR